MPPIKTAQHKDMLNLTETAKNTSASVQGSFGFTSVGHIVQVGGA